MSQHVWYLVETWDVRGEKEWLRIEASSEKQARQMARREPDVHRVGEVKLA